jgi:hypothetical protein
MRAGARMFVLIGAVLALGLVSVGGPLPAADAVEPWVCHAKGQMYNTPIPTIGGWSYANWTINFSGTCIGPDGVQPLTGSGGNLFSNFAGECALFYPGTFQPNYVGTYVNLNVGAKVFRQWWTFATRYSGPYDISAVTYSPHPHVQGQVGEGLRLTRLALKCPGDPTADFTFAFAQNPS